MTFSELKILSRAVLGRMKEWMQICIIIITGTKHTQKKSPSITARTLAREREVAAASLVGNVKFKFGVH